MQDSEFDINAVDFNSIRIGIELTNSTTRTSVKKPDDVKVIEIQDQGLMIEVPKRSCADGHNLVLDIKITFPSQETARFETTAKVKSIQSVSDQFDQVEVTFVQFDETAWKKFIRHFSDRQGQIEKFFSSSRGF